MRKLTLTTLLITMFTICILIFSACSQKINVQTKKQIETSATTYTTLSKRFIETLKVKGDVSVIIDSLAKVDAAVLAAELTDDNRRKAFWMNVYNGFILVTLNENPDLYKDRGAFFKAEQITIANEILSFDKIEHGLIRRSINKLSLGFLPKLFVDDFEKKFRTDKTDPRVHLALNCGAKSCPAVAAYDAERLDEQMDQSTTIHLKNTSKYDEENNVVYITSLFYWFRADFGDVPDFLRFYNVIPESENNPNIKYNDYDWTLYLDNFIEL
jgi:hypothetical protein